MAPSNRSQSPQQQFAHQRMKVYESAAGFVTLAHQIVNHLPSGNAALSDQLRRASVSVCLNIAEGAGEYRSEEKARFYRMARRSATESAAIVDILGRLNSAPEEDLRRATQTLFEIVSMLTGLVKSLAGRKR